MCFNATELYENCQNNQPHLCLHVAVATEQNASFGGSCTLQCVCNEIIFSFMNYFEENCDYSTSVGLTFLILSLPLWQRLLSLRLAV